MKISRGKWAMSMAALALVACQPEATEIDGGEEEQAASAPAPTSKQAAPGSPAVQSALPLDPVCGDAICNGEETATTCPLDCVADPPFLDRILQDGGTWQLKAMTGAARNDATGQMEGFSGNYWIIHPGGLDSAPILPVIKQELQAQVRDARDVLTVSDRILDEIELSLAQGVLTPYLRSIAEDDRAPLPRSSDSSKEEEPDLGAMASCSDKDVTKAKTVSLSSSLNLSNSLGGGFTGTLSATGGLQASATGELLVRLKRFKLFGKCIPYAVKFGHLKAYGTATVGYDATLSGSVSYANSWSWELIKIPLFSLSFFIGPLPVHIGFNLPINYGLDLQASVTGSVTFEGAQSATGTFDYLCTPGGGCSGSSNYTQSGGSTPSTTGSISGRIQPNLWVQAAFRGYLYSEWLAYAQLGVRPYLRGDLWGYYGNACGDANGDNVNEVVDALTLDLDLQVHLTAEARAFGATPTQWNDLWHTPRYHLAFWDLIGSEALQPMLGGPARAPLFYPQVYTARMRPCFPWTDPVTYRFNWGDGSAQTQVSGPPATLTGAAHVWSSLGSKALTTTALTDAHGRVFDKLMSRTIKVAPPVWTSWLNRDAPGGAGDYETRADFTPVPCNGVMPLTMQCQTLAGVDWSQTGETYSCSLPTGGVCKNADQPDGMCQDYQVRFLCPP